MKNLETFYSNNVIENSENLYLYFTCGQNKYALNIKEIVEIMKLPQLDYPQKLANNIVGLLNYNNFTINILDLRFYLNIKVTPYSVSNQVLIVKTDESIFGLIIDKVEDVISLEETKIKPFDSSESDRIIGFTYNLGVETISIVNLVAIENKIRQGVDSINVDIPSLFPTDDDSRYKLKQRSLALQEKTNLDLMTNVLSQDKFISFSLSDNIYCINLEYVKEFLKNCQITHLPSKLDYVAGVTALRGDFITIIDIKKFLDIDNVDSNSDYSEGKNRVIIMNIPDYKFGFLVDEIFQIININEELIKKNPQNQNKFVLSEVVLEDKVYTILDMKTILSDERFFIDEN